MKNVLTLFFFIAPHTEYDLVSMRFFHAQFQIQMSTPTHTHHKIDSIGLTMRTYSNKSKLNRQIVTLSYSISIKRI